MATINGTAGNDTLTGTAGSDTVSGFGGNDNLTGSGGVDWVEGGLGNDTVRGGSGQDSLVFREAGTANADLLEDYASNYDNIQLDAAFFTAIGASGRFASGDTRFWSSTSGTAHDANDRIVLNTSTGQLWYDADGNGSGAAQLIATLPSGRTVVASDLWIFGTPPGGGQTINGTPGNDSLVGGPGNDTINGFAGEDTIDGGLGADSMVGGAHADTYFVDNPGDVITELDGGGFDTVNASVSYTLPAWVNHLTLTGTAAINGTGNELANAITGNNAANTLTGGEGIDTLIGGQGADRYVLSAPAGNTHADVISSFKMDTDKIVLDGAMLANVGPSGNFTNADPRFWAAGGGIAHDADDRVIYDPVTGDIYYDSDGTGGAPSERIATHANANGFALEANDVAVINGSGAAGLHLVGTASNDTLVGGAGNDTLEGLGGLDSLIGNAGDDVLAGGGDGDDLNAGAGNDRLEGGPGMDWMTGGSGADTFAFTAQPVEANLELIRDFATGIDRLELDGSVIWNMGPSGSFAAGDARFHAAPGANAAHDASDRIIYNSSNGWLFFDADGTGSTWAPEHFATLQVGATLVATDIAVVNGSPRTGVDRVGTSGNDSMVGTSGDDAMEGLAGDDTLEGLDGHDLLIGNEGNDSLVGGDGNDVLEGRAGDDVLLGGVFYIDTLRGDEGNDTLDGGGGGDFIYTGAGSDRVLFTQPAASWNHQSIADFSSGADKLAFDLHANPAIGATGDFSAGDERFYAAPGATFAHDASDRLIYNTSNGQLFYDPDGLGGAAAQHIASFPGGTPLSATDISVFDSRAGRHIVGTSGDDSLVGTTGDDSIEGLAGDDTLQGNAGRDTLDGGSGNDTYLGDSGDVLLDAGGIDTVIGKHFGVMADGIENLALRGSWDPSVIFPFVTGNSLDNVITNEEAIFAMLDGGDGDDTLIGGGGTDQFFLSGESGNYGSDVVDGRGGVDAFNLQGVASAVVVDFRAGTITGGGTGGSGSVSFTNVERAIGGSFDDRLLAHDGGGLLEGYLGNDTIIGGTGDDHLGGDGNWHDHPISEFGGNDQLFGGGGNDRLTDWEGDDLLDGGTGDDIFGLASEFGEQGNDTVIGGDGTDTVISDAGLFADLEAGILDTGNSITTLSGIENLTIRFGPQDARIMGNAGSNVLSGGEGRDTIEARAGNDTVYGDEAGHSGGVPPTHHADRLLGEDGNDFLVGRWGSDTLEGGSGNDTLNGGAAPEDFDKLDDHDDTLDGGAGNDSLIGSLGADSFHFTVAPGVGNADQVSEFVSVDDQLVLDGAVHANSGPSGTFAASDARFWSSGTGTAHDADDRVIYNTSNGQLWYDADGNGAGARQLIATLQGSPSLAATDIAVVNGSGGGGQVINGTAGNDTLTGTAGNDTINGLGGNDLFVAGSSGGVDVINGGAGFDSIEFASRATSAMVVDFAAGTISGGSSGTISFTGIERVVAGSFNDSLTGNGAAQNLGGNAGADTLWGAGGIDTLWGGGGADTFIFRETGTSNADSVRDWASGSDKVALDNSPMSALGAMGNFAAGDARFWSSSTGTAHDANDRVIYNTSTGSLYYDADGSGAGAAQLIATFQGAPGVAATDITVI